MTRISAKVTFEKLDRKLKKLEQVPTAGLLAALKISVLNVHASAVAGIRSTSGGQKKTRYNPKRQVTVSKPGDPPNTDTGRLIGSIQFDVDEKKLRGFVGTNLKYGAWLEFGTKDMDKRPWLKPALKKQRKEIPAIFATKVRNALKRGAPK